MAFHGTEPQDRTALPPIVGARSASEECPRVNNKRLGIVGVVLLALVAAG